MSNANEVVVRYLAAWNEPEPKRRRELVVKAWTDDGTHVELLGSLCSDAMGGRFDALKFTYGCKELPPLPPVPPPD